MQFILLCKYISYNKKIHCACSLKNKALKKEKRLESVKSWEKRFVFFLYNYLFKKEIFKLINFKYIWLSFSFSFLEYLKLIEMFKFVILLTTSMCLLIILNIGCMQSKKDNEKWNLEKNAICEQVNLIFIQIFIFVIFFLI